MAPKRPLHCLGKFDVINENGRPLERDGQWISDSKLNLHHWPVAGSDIRRNRPDTRDPYTIDFHMPPACGADINQYSRPETHLSLLSRLALTRERILASDLPPADKQKWIDQLRSLPADATKQLVLKLMEKGLERTPEALLLIGTLLGKA